MLVKIGKGLEIEVDTKKLSAPVMDHVVYMGLRNILMDSHASIKIEEENFKAKAMALVNKKLNSMYAGEVHALASRDRLDVVEACARQLALDHVQNAVKKAGKRLNSHTNDWYYEQCTKFWRNFEKQAQEIVKIRSAERNVVLDGLDV